MARIPKTRRASSSGVDWSFTILAAIGCSAALAVLLRDGWSVFLHVLFDDTVLFVEILPKVFAGTLLGALVRVLVPRDVIRARIGEGSGLPGLLFATAAGIIFPGGPFTIFPLAAAFLLIGADRGATIAFISAWLLLGFNRAIIWEMPFFGTDIVLWRSLWSLPLPILAGLLARWIRWPLDGGSAP